jgi:predicted regulator of Ras-like GTPase activity (Roadblock/LC7/MglB family)
VLDASLVRVLEAVPGVEAVALVDGDGMVVSVVGARREAMELVAASYADLARRAMGAHHEGDLAPPEEMMLAGAGGSVVFRSVAGDYGLIAVLGPRGLLGRLRFELRKAGATIGPELEL